MTPQHTTRHKRNGHQLPKHMTKCVCFAISVLLSSTTHANIEAKPSNLEAESTQKLAAELKSLQMKSNNHSSFRVQFEQKVFSALRKKTTTSSGQLTFTQPKKFRWEISSPSKEVYVNNGEWFWKYVESTKHALRMSANTSDLDFLDVVFQLDKLSQKYRISKIPALTAEDNLTPIKCPKDHTCIALEPLQTSSQKNIALAINKSSGFVAIIKIEFRNGNRTLINFNSLKPDKFSENHFEFTPPPGTAVDKR